ncbi:hypothetical protein ACWCQL_37685 [Streptomyces sp. NPDC002073]|uniref:hypothetical protein n=1 Tax=Streptomyces sp. NBC_00239 TaxID=2903640 RepID=UPI002E2C82C7|nr:hypothetical protein [Streptomyces sp. NBC_00239]
MHSIEFFVCPQRVDWTEEDPVGDWLWGIRVDGVDLRAVAADATRERWTAELAESEPDLTDAARERIVLGQHAGLSEEDLVSPADHFTGRSAEWFAEAGDDRTVLLGCRCGVWACWPLCARLTVDADTVTWSGFLQPYRREEWGELPIGPYVFERTAYEKALAHPTRLTSDPLAEALREPDEDA